MQWQKQVRQFAFILAVFLVFHACICPFKLHIPSFHADSTNELLFASHTLPSADEQMLSERLTGSSYESASTGRIRLPHRSIVRSFYDTLMCDAFWLSALLWLLLLLKCSMRIREFLPRSLQLVQFLHRADGKASALVSHTR